MTTPDKYPGYRASAVPWAPELPDTWTTRRARWLFHRRVRPVREGDEVITCFRDGIVTLRKNRRIHGFTESITESGYQGIRRGDLVIHTMDAFAGAAGVADSDGKATPAYAVCEPRPDVDARYYAHVVREMARCGWILALTRGIRERSSDFQHETFAEQLLPVPPLSEQSAIVRFLADVDRRIQRYVNIRQTSRELLDEHRSSLIHAAMTRGLDPDAPRKHAGIAGLGDIPAHWQVRRARAVCSAIVDCKNRTPPEVEGGRHLVVRTACIRNHAFDPAGGYRTDEPSFRAWTTRGAPRPGDVFFTREAPAGEACLVPARDDLCMGQRMMYPRPDPEQLEPRFLLYNLVGPRLRTHVELTTNGSTVGHLRVGQVHALPILWCPLAEQRAILAHIDRETARIDRARATAQREIDLLREYRTRLVADVVTGKLDVRAAAAGLPDPDLSDEQPGERA